MSEERLGQVQIHCPELKDLFHASQNFEELKPPPPHPHIERVTYSSCCNFVDQGCAFSLSFCRENVLESTTDKGMLDQLHYKLYKLSDLCDKILGG